MAIRGKFLFAAILLISFWGCSHDEISDTLKEAGTPKANITYIVSTNGIGDNGYNDNTLAGLFRFNEDTGIPIQIIQPASLDDARKAAKKWLKNHSTGDSALLVLASSEYDSIAKELNADIPTENKILLFEADSQKLPKSVSTFNIDRYGASYLAGAIVGKIPTTIFASSPGFHNVETSIEAFKKGFNAHKVVSDTPTVIYVSSSPKDETAGNNIIGAYTSVIDMLQSDLDNKNPPKVIFPLLGESSIGALRAIEDFAFTLDLIIGMDTDKSGVSPRVPFSVVVDTRGVFLKYLNEWKAGKDWPRHRVFGMAEGATAIMWNENFDEEQFWSPKKFDNTESFRARYDKYYDEALQKEKKHAKK